MGSGGAKVAQEGEEPGDSGDKFEKGGKNDLSEGPAKKRGMTDVICLILFIVHIGFFWFVILQDVQYAAPMKLVLPRDYSGAYCGMKENWNDGGDMSDHEHNVYTLNMDNTIKGIARTFACTTFVRSIVTSGSRGTDQITTSDFDAVCPSLDPIGSITDMANNLRNSVGQYTSLNGFGNFLSSGGSDFFSAATSNFNSVCLSTCDVGGQSTSRSGTYMPPGDEDFYAIWMTLTRYCASSTGSSDTTCTSGMAPFRFNALPQSVCPYSDAMMCVPLPGVNFKEATFGRCTMEISSGLVSEMGNAGSQMATYLVGSAATDLSNKVSGNFEAAVADFQRSIDTFCIVCALSFVIGLVFLVLLRFCVKPVVWISILLVFLFFVLGGVFAWVWSVTCADQDFADAASDLKGSAVANQTITSSDDECNGYYKVEDEWARNTLKGFAVALWILGLVWFLMICCLCSRIRLAIAINEVAAMFVYQTPHILLLPVVQVLVGLCWCGVYFGLATVLLSQVPDNFVPDGCYQTERAAKGTNDDPGPCRDMYPKGDVWRNSQSTQCTTNQCCYQCSQPRYVSDYRVWYSFFSFLWTNAFSIAIGQCIIAGAVGVWFFSPEKGGRLRSFMSVCISTKNTMIYHLGSLAFGSLILAIVQFIRYVFQYLAEQSKANHNKILEIVFRILAYVVWCFEKCVKFLNKNAYIQVALLGTNFCTSAKNAFFLILRNCIRFGLLGGLGQVVHFIGRFFVMIFTGVVGFLILEAMHQDISSPVALTAMYVLVGYFVGSLFMNVFGLAVDSTLQCFIATEEMNIPREFVPERLQGFITATCANAENEKEKGCCACF